MIDGRIATTGCVGVSLAGAVRADCVLSQGTRPIGPNLIVTSAQGQFVRSLGGRPALRVLEEIIESIDPEKRNALGGGLLLGRVVNEYKDHFGRADYLMRSVVGVMKEDQAIAVADRVRVGQTVRFHVRDAATAHEDLAMLLDAQALHETPAGALVFTCNGRGVRFFPSPHHDAQTIQQAFQQDQPAEIKAKAGTPITVRDHLPLAGMFAAGEIGRPRVPPRTDPLRPAPPEALNLGSTKHSSKNPPPADMPSQGHGRRRRGLLPPRPRPPGAIAWTSSNTCGCRSSPAPLPSSSAASWSGPSCPTTATTGPNSPTRTPFVTPSRPTACRPASTSFQSSTSPPATPPKARPHGAARPRA
ncbi:MAG: FIST C-terminal domain-containing protein, partial [Phycisphaerales bacterium]|nr:FIST C-terminal domain-containing protein [Phycisphaerales bacterium]